MAAISGVTSKTDLKAAMERDRQMDLAKFNHEAERYLHQKTVEVEDAEINVADDR